MPDDEPTEKPNENLDPPADAGDEAAVGALPPMRPQSPSSPLALANAASDEDNTKSATDGPLDLRQEDPEPPLVAPEPPGPSRWLPLAIAIALPALFFFLLPPLTKSGLWDPYELNVADLARRIALNLHGAQSLALGSADNSLPHLNDLGRPQLPFTSIALGFKFFGLHEWAGRFPLAAWGLAGVLATYAFVARLFDRRAALYAAVALTTMPLYFVQARSMLGDVCTMSAFAMAFGGLAVAVFDRDERGPTSLSARLPWITLAAVGLVAGYGSRGGVLGIAVPTIGVGLAWGLSWAGGGRRADPIGDIVGAVGLAGGIAVLGMAIPALTADTPAKDLNLWVGATLHTQPKYPTFDFYLGSIGHALAPWSAFLPFAMGRLFVPPVGRVGFLHQRESFARMALLVGVTVAFVAHGYLAARTDMIAFCGPALAAAACGVAIRDFERGAHASVAVGVGTGVLLGVFHHDFHELPDKAYQAFAVVGAAFPESFKPTALSLWWVVLGGFALVAFLTWAERDSPRAPFDPKNYLRILRALREAWDGLLALAYFATVAGASLAGLFIWVGVRTHAKWLPTMSLQIRDVLLNAWWIVAFVPLGAILATFFACDLWLWAFNRSRAFGKSSFTRGFEPFEEIFRRVRESSGAEKWTCLGVLVPLMVIALPGGVLAYLVSHGTRPVTAAALAIPSGVALFLLLGLAGDVVRHRAAALALGGAAVGAVLCVAYYPALANQLSPKDVFDSFQRVHKGCEPLALLGVGSRTSAYYAGGQPMTFNDPQSAYSWLKAPDPCGRRYLALKSEELPKLNEMYREQSEPHVNLPVLDARSSQILLASSSLASGEKSENPLDKIILSSPPHPQRKLDVVMTDQNGREQLQVLGIDVLEVGGKLVDVVAPGRKYHMRTYYRVLDKVGTEWEAFIHIDGYRRRHNGDHKPMAGKYPMSLWQKDDLLVDEYEFALEPNFTPGAYTIYFGLFVGDTRLKVKSGPSDGENRINGGQLRVQ